VEGDNVEGREERYRENMATRGKTPDQGYIRVKTSE